jgi:hypothetical protein
MCARCMILQIYMSGATLSLNFLSIKKPITQYVMHPGPYNPKCEFF